MQIYLKFVDLDLWNIIINRYTPTKKNYKEWSENEMRLATLDVKGLNTLFCTITQDEFNRISN